MALITACSTHCGMISNAVDLPHSMDDKYKSAVYKLPPLKIYIDTSLSESIDTSYIHTFSGRLRNIILGMVWQANDEPMLL